MSTPIPDPADRQGASIMSPPPGPDTEGSSQLLDAGALEAEGTEREDMAAAAAAGDAPLRQAEELADQGGRAEAVPTADRDAPYVDSPSRSDTAAS